MNDERTFGKGSSDIVEKYDIQKVPVSERVQKESSLFYLWFGANLTIGDFALGFIPVYLGLDINLTIIALVLGNFFGGILLASMSVMGPPLGLPQMMIGRRPFGRKGGAVMSILQWGNTAGWLTVNIVLAAFALTVALKGLYSLFAILIVALIVGITAYIGHRFVHLFERVMSIILGILFVLVTYLSLTKYDMIISYTPSYEIPAVAGFGITLAASFSYIMAWGPYAADYSRYVSPQKSMKKVFIYTFFGGFLASVWLEIVGMFVGMISRNPAGNPAIDLNTILGSFGFIGMIALFLGGLAANALNLYSNSLSLRAAGINIRRTFIVIIVSAVSIVVAYFGYRNFYSFYETFLLILDYWITPWLGVLIADYFVVNRGKEISPKTMLSFNRPGILSYVIAVVVSLPFMAPPAYYEGIVAHIMGGVDISYYISFFLAFILYIVFCRMDKKL